MSDPRDFFSLDVGDGPEGGEADPIRRAKNLAKRDLPKRFYKDVAVETVDGGFRVTLDGRAMKTPAKRPLVVPTAALADVIAAEWRGQGSEIDPGTMPVTRLANSVVDGVVDRMVEVAEDAAKYAGTDLICYRAEQPERLVERQTALWDPILDWAEEALGARFLVADGIMHVAQDAEALMAVRRAFGAYGPWALAGLHTVTTLTGSALVALALARGRLDADAAWEAAHVDEHWSFEVWGRDAEAEARLAHRRTEFDAAVSVRAVERRV
jgi:chaperone required for assembly of F1-ATPase